MNPGLREGSKYDAAMDMPTSPAADAAQVRARIEELASRFAAERAERQARTALHPADFDALRAAGYLLCGVPADQGGTFVDAARSVREVAGLLRTLARGDSSVALVCAMHPAVLSYWLTTPVLPPESAALQGAWDRQRRRLFALARDGALFGTITSEPGSGGDIARTRAEARPVPAGDGDGDGGYLLWGRKHFGSGSGVTAFMITTAVPAGEREADWFVLDVRGVPWDGSRGLHLEAAWDGQGMKATQSHGMRFAAFPAVRVAWPGHRQAISEAAAPFISCLFAAVAVGIVDAAMALGGEQLAPRLRGLRPYEQVEWSRAEIDAWLLRQAFAGMLAAVEDAPPRPREAAQGKVAIAELAEACLQRVCRVLGGGSYSRRSPFGHWFEDVRALGFLRPPWGLAYDALIGSGAPPP